MFVCVHVRAFLIYKEFLVHDYAILYTNISVRIVQSVRNII